ncbi:MAG: pitrilysin family protein [Chlorobiota bacterium]
MGIRRRSALPPRLSIERAYAHWRLPNGVTVLSEQIPSAYSVVLGIWVLAGSRDEDPSYNGVAHLLEHLVAGSSQRHSAYQLAIAFERLGAEINAYTTKELTCYYVQTLRASFHRVLELLVEQLIHPRYSPRLLERERRIISEELLSYADDPEEMLYEHAERLLFGDHPLGLPITGTRETLERISPEVVADFHSRFYVGERILVGVTGNISPEEVFTAISSALASIPPIRVPLPQRTPPRLQSDGELTLYCPFHQGYITVARLLPKLSSQERAALALLNFLLAEGWSSRLYQRIRERYGLAYHITSELEWFSDCGMWSITASGSPSGLARIEQLISSELQHLVQEGIRPSEFSRGRNFLRARLAMLLDSPADSLATLARAILLDDGHEPFLHAFQSLESLSYEHVNLLAARYCSPEQWSIIRLLPKGHA